MKRQVQPLGVPQTSHGNFESASNAATQVANSPPYAIEKWLAARIADSMGNPPVRLVLWDGSVPYAPDEAVGSIRFNDRAGFWRSVWSPELGMGDAFSTGSLSVDGDLIDVLYHCIAGIEVAGHKNFKRSLSGRLPLPDANTLSGSARHVAHHYDLGNDFYRLWLDDEMVYTCAYYPTPEATLEQAQVAKMDHVARKLCLKPGMLVVEAGCGWGALAVHMARNYGVKVRAFNISKEQLAFARERADMLGMSTQVEFVEDDYRNVSGACDAFVSVGMLEHVGLDNYRELGAVIKRTLAPHGHALVHSVGRATPTPVNAWLEKRIFPGSYPPAISEMMSIFEPNALVVCDLENLRLHYAKTLTDWLERFDTHVDDIRAMYDDTFVRAWRLYLAGCAASFKASSLQLFQVVVTHPRFNNVPVNRAHLYQCAPSPDWNM